MHLTTTCQQRQIATLQRELEEARAIQAAEKKILIEEVAKNAELSERLRQIRQAVVFLPCVCLAGNGHAKCGRCKAIEVIDRIISEPVGEVASEGLAHAGNSGDAVASAAKALVDAMETCHGCQCTVIIEEYPTHCENCSWDCDEHDEPNCQTIYTLHDKLKTALYALSKDVKLTATGVSQSKEAMDQEACSECARLREYLERIVVASRGVPDQLGADRQGDCNLSDCDCSNHLAREALF